MSSRKRYAAVPHHVRLTAISSGWGGLSPSRLIIRTVLADVDAIVDLENYENLGKTYAPVYTLEGAERTVKIYQRVDLLTGALAGCTVSEEGWAALAAVGVTKEVSERVVRSLEVPPHFVFCLDTRVLSPVYYGTDSFSDCFFIAALLAPLYALAGGGYIMTANELIERLRSLTEDERELPVEMSITEPYDDDAATLVDDVEHVEVTDECGRRVTLS